MDRPCTDCRPQGASSAEIAKAGNLQLGMAYSTIIHYLYQKKHLEFCSLSETSSGLSNLIFFPGFSSPVELHSWSLCFNPHIFLICFVFFEDKFPWEQKILTAKSCQFCHGKILKSMWSMCPPPRPTSSSSTVPSSGSSFASSVTGSSSWFTCGTKNPAQVMFVALWTPQINQIDTTIDNYRILWTYLPWILTSEMFVGFSFTQKFHTSSYSKVIPTINSPSSPSSPTKSPSHRCQSSHGSSSPLVVSMTFFQRSS